MSLPKPAPARDKNRPQKPEATARAAAMESIGVAEASFLAAFDNVLVDDPTHFDFNGAINRKHMRAVWNWLTRDVVPDLPQEIETAVISDEPVEAVIDGMVPDILTKIRKIVTEAQTSAEVERRLKVQLGGDDVRERLPVFINAFRCRSLLAKATAFGRASNNLQDDAALGAALQSMPWKDAGIAALLLHAVVGQSANPSRLVSSMIPLAGGASEAIIKGAGFGPLIEAVLSHSQAQLSRIANQNGLFVDADLMCKAVSRFHKLVRSISGYVEFERGSRWSMMLTEITKQMAQRIEPRLREISPDLSQSLRRPREGADRVDPDRLLAALNGIYLLATLRDARESLALNALFDTVWNETGQSLEVLLTRNLEVFKQNPDDENTAHRLEMGIKMAEIRFNAEYADILRRARDTALNRRLERPA
ncbi:hypothetical protein [Mariluticola halotolerans]|uniref:hypothetical protein n=1 Tax=Mariluticola halotolerans TaxID=2909283 RepID=UPI0026E1A755|nr:hypothetical protein [Mariluticola halotolerans]UJQ95716.1 hypothetical protein L1P08_06945 [Mariluticola halotolerans]